MSVRKNLHFQINLTKLCKLIVVCFKAKRDLFRNINNLKFQSAEPTNKLCFPSCSEI